MLLRPHCRLFLRIAHRTKLLCAGKIISCKIKLVALLRSVQNFAAETKSCYDFDTKNWNISVDAGRQASRVNNDPVTVGMSAESTMTR